MSCTWTVCGPIAIAKAFPEYVLFAMNVWILSACCCVQSNRDVYHLWSILVLVYEPSKAQPMRKKWLVPINYLSSQGQSMMNLPC